MLGQRILTAVIGIIAAIYIINFGQWVFAIAALILTLLAWHEYFNMIVRREIKISYYHGFVGILLLWGTAWLGNSQETLAILLFTCFAILAKAVISPARFTIRDAVYTISGIVYIGLSFAHLVMLRYTDSTLYYTTKLGTLSAGAAYIWLAFIGTWAADTFAFLVGTTFGKHKLAPAVSPGKTWEGTLGGVAGSVLGVTLMAYTFQIPITHGLIIGLLVGVIAPLGDLVESSIKRYAGVKDSGRLLPGHGGVLDRFDSIMFVAPTVYYYIQLFIAR